MSTRSLNKVFLIGNLTRDPELRYTSSGTPVVTFGVATNRKYKDSSQNVVETAEFTNVVAWSKLAEICSKILKKGSKVWIEGRLSTTTWDDAKTGQKMRRTEVVATDMFVLSSPRGAGAEPHDPETADHMNLDDLDGMDITDMDTAFPADDKDSGDSTSF